LIFWEEKTFYIFAQADEVGMDKNAVMLLDQLRALDNRRFIQKLGKLPDEYHSKVNQSLQIILDLI
jgi:mRNA interferase MazF